MNNQDINSNIKKQSMVLGYKVIHIEKLKELKSVLYQLEHKKTGAKHIHISNKDKENTFGVIFKTIPYDSTGIAHILEHTVLCGSKKFNVRDPFFSMLKRGLSTFMNALTAPDWTMYPFSTQNKKDFYNLMDVYLDAVFFPNLDILSFKQEGYRIETINGQNQNNENLELIYKGVVYNEMKGAMSSPSQIMEHFLLSGLFPDTTYSFNSGGDPFIIPSLKHDDLKQFHLKYYHPCNSFFYTYGSLPLKDHLEFIEKKVLHKFTRKNPSSFIASQKKWKKPKQIMCNYPLSKDKNPEKKHQVCVAWMTADIKDSFEILVLNVLAQILLGNAASPLRKALIDSELGTALSDCSGFDADIKNSIFACGLRDIFLGAVKKVEKIIFQTLQNVVKNGIKEKLIKSAIHQIEFHQKEITNTPHPFGIKLLLSLAGTWIHNGEPLACLKFNKNLDRLKKEIQKKGFLENKIKKYFLENPHRVLLVMCPSQDMEEKQDKKTKHELLEILKKMQPHEIKQIKQDADKLMFLQEEKEDVSSLPCLKLSDVPIEIEIIKPDIIKENSQATFYNKTTSDILYFSCPFNLLYISKQKLFLIPFFCKAFTNAGTLKRDYAKMAELMDLYTGGIAISPFTGTDFSKNKKNKFFLSLQGKALDRNIENLFNLINEFITQYSFSDITRLKKLLFQYQAAMEASIVSNGHRYAILLASRNFTKTSFLSEMWHGISQYKFIKKLTKKINKSDSKNDILNILSKDLHEIADFLFYRKNLNPVIVGGKNSLIKADKRILSILNNLPEKKHDAAKKLNINTKIPYEGWFTSTSVSFVAQAFKTVRFGHKDAPAMAVISKMLRSLYLHREIREKGGAYGGFAMYSPEEGIFSFGSYRDPYIGRTLEVYENSCDFIIKGDYSENDVKEAILQVCAEIDKPETPGPAAIKAFYRDVLNLTDEKRKNFKFSLLELNKKTIQKIAEKYFNLENSEKGTAIISSKDKLEQENMNLESHKKPFELFEI
ncbi:MAG: peptidase M16 [Desulfobacteraceae bacterium 4572_130]|nr:MAG: peptidase M16 [Desulfobacteraceae bacterium 4572_130]